MPTELTMLALSVLLLFVLIVIQATAGAMAHGVPAMLGNRDDLPPSKIFEARSKRTVANMIEGMAIFAPLVLVATLASISTPTTMLGAQLFLYGRIAHSIAYLGGIPYFRTVAWTVAMSGPVLIFLSLFGL
jgi:uncharacterized MAPEG superfamily protein